MKNLSLTGFFGIAYIVLSALVAPAQCILTGCQSYYPFTGNTQDMSGMNLHGTNNNAVLSNGVNSNPNESYQFNGTTSFIRAGSDNRNIVDSLTIVAWVRTTSPAYQWVVGKYAATQDLGYHLYTENGNVSISGRNGSGIYRSSGISSTLVDDGAWHMLTGIIASPDWKVYVDCNLENQAAHPTSSPILNPTVDLTIGHYLVLNSQYFSGEIDEVQVYNRALNHSEIIQLYNCHFPCAVLNIPPVQIQLSPSHNDIQIAGQLETEDLQEVEVLWRIPGGDFQQISTIHSFEQENSMQFLHSSPTEGLNQYMLKASYKDQLIKYSGIGSVWFNSNASLFTLVQRGRQLIIETPNGEAFPVPIKLEILNLLGEVVDRKTCDSSQPYPMHSLPPGCYCATAISKSHESVLKFVLLD